MWGVHSDDSNEEVSDTTPIPLPHELSPLSGLPEEGMQRHPKNKGVPLTGVRPLLVSLS